MPLPDGYSQVRGNRSLIRAPDGELVTRTQAENIFAQQHGFRTDYHYKQFSRMVGRSTQSKQQLSEARERGISMKKLRALQAKAMREAREGADVRRPGGPIHELQVLLGNASADIDAWAGSPTVRGVGG